MPDTRPVPLLPDGLDAPEAPPVPLFRRPAVVAGLAVYFVAIGALAFFLFLAESGTPDMPEPAFPNDYEVQAAWAQAAFPHIAFADPALAKIRFVQRVNDLRGLAELYEMQRCWGKAAQAYEEIALLIPAPANAVNRYVRERVKALVQLER